jgi:hypothetical protein
MVASAPESAAVPSGALGRQTERRIAWLTLAWGLTGVLVAAALGRFAWAFGLGVGTALAWLNFRLLRRGMDAFVEAAKQQSASRKAQVPLATYAAMALRYGLIAAVVYATFELLKVPLLSMVVGLCALGAAAISASVYEVLRP